MKKIVLTGVALTLLLTSCSADPLLGGSDPTSTTGQTQASTRAPQMQSTTTPSETTGKSPLLTDDMQTRLEYYEELVNGLQKELLSVRSEWYMDRVAYESEIESLKAQLSAQSTQVGTTGTPSIPNAPTSVPFTYQEKNGGITILSYTGTATSVTVPQSINGIPVLAIADRAFENRTRLRSVVLPEGVTSLGWFGFAGCVSLESVTLPASIKSISYGAFENCSSALIIYAPNNSYAAAYAQSYGIRTVKT